MKHWNRDYWPGRSGHEYQFVTFEGELDEPGELRGLWNARCGSSGTEAEKDFVGSSEGETTVRQVADVRDHVGLVAKESADLSWA